MGFARVFSRVMLLKRGKVVVGVKNEKKSPDLTSPLSPFLVCSSSLSLSLSFALKVRTDQLLWVFFS